MTYQQQATDGRAHDGSRTDTGLLETCTRVSFSDSFIFFVLFSRYRKKTDSISSAFTTPGRIAVLCLKLAFDFPSDRVGRTRALERTFLSSKLALELPFKVLQIGEIPPKKR